MRKQNRLLSGRQITITSLIVAAVGVVIQIISGAPYPPVPPVFLILLIPAGLIAFGHWRWTPILAVVAGLFLISGLFLSGALVRLFDLSQFGVCVGLWIQMLGVLVATIAGIMNTVRNYQHDRRRIRSEP
ncbi:MAG TPA: hypothetical protein V6C57_05070 [Coleofasciculaceae cyanobacterium]